ncbi:unnamed protein product [Timema podura]|uniref:Small ribosomal subunit protein bS6m n=1 Tax=Timema podura TaxID=61482 RepID=A0ABN7NDS3_TIMPD|nr:unnamed protein product [Timema podura]
MNPDLRVIGSSVYYESDDALYQADTEAEAIFETGGFIRQLENLGTREIPYKTSAHGQVHKKASYFLLRFDCPPKHLYDLSEGYGRDVDIVRHRVYKVKDPEQFECTIEEETKPPAYRQVIIITVLFPSLICEEIAVLLWDVMSETLPCTIIH